MAQQADLKINVRNTIPMVAALARRGDTILIGFDRTLSDQELEDLREAFEGFTETTGVHIGFVEHATSMVVARGSEGDDEDAFLPVYEPPSVTLEGYEAEGER